MKIPLLKTTASCAGKLAACLILGAATLSQAASVPSYGAAVLADNPVAFWQLNEASGSTSAIDSGPNALNGTYGADGVGGAVAPQSPPYAGFTNGQTALATSTSDAASVVTLTNLNLNATNVDTTIAMWIEPTGYTPDSGGLLYERTANNSDAAGLGFSGTANASGMHSLGYQWNGNGYQWNSGLFPVLSTWQLVALVVQSNQATIYLYYIDADGNQHLQSAVNTGGNTPETWAYGAQGAPRGGIVLGSDPYDTANRAFPGNISGAAVFNSALTQNQILALFAAGVGVTGFAPSITTQPQSQYVVSGSPTTLSATGIGGTTPFAYQWQLNGTNVNLLADSANFSGANSNVLSILSAAAIDEGSYQLIITNVIGTTVSSNATLTLQSAALVGQWFTNGTLADVSGYQPAGTHDGYDINNTGSYLFTNDVPPSKTGQSLLLYNGDTGIAISNSATSDTGYTNTFDNRINHSFTVGCFAKGWPGVWNPFVSKNGETDAAINQYDGWELRNYGNNNTSPCWTIRGTGQNDDMAATGINLASDTNNWHFYVGTFDAGTGVRNLYVDGVLSATETNNSAYALSPLSHLCIGAQDNAGTMRNYFTGQIYDVRVYNNALTVSQILNWYGAVAPAIASQPAATAVLSGLKATFTVNASGTPPLTYQWQLNGTNLNLLPDAANFTGINSNVLTVLGATANDAGSYHVIVTSTLGYGTVTSSNALLTIVPRLLVGEWFTNGTLTDLSGYQPAGTHDGYDAAGNGDYAFSTDVPPGRTGQSLSLTKGDTAIAIANSSTADGAYTNTFDDTIANAMTVAFWAKGFPGGWSYFLTKNGDSGTPQAGWNIRRDGWYGGNNASWTMRSPGGTVSLGAAAYGGWDFDDLGTENMNIDAGAWHHYAGTYNKVTGIRSLYVDGVPVAQITNCGSYNLAAYSHLVIGGFEASPGGTIGSYFTGKFYDVRVYNNDLSSNQVAQLAAIPDPAIVGDPQSVTAYIGLTASLNGSAIGTAPLSYQWQFNGTNLVDGVVAGTSITGATSNVLTIVGLTTNHQGAYHLVVSNLNGTATSRAGILTVVPAVAPTAGTLVGAWLTGATNLADTSGYTPAGTHDGYGVTGAGVVTNNYAFTNEVPPGATGQSLTLNGNCAIAITNSSTLDANYTNTYDDTLTNMTVAFWAKGLPAGWLPWVSKRGDDNVGWQLRIGNPDGTPCWTVRDGGVGSYTLGGGPGWASTGDQDDMHSGSTVDGNWHFYAGTFDGTTGIRNLYVDGTLKAQEIGNVPYGLAAASHLTIGGRDSVAGNSFDNYYTGEIYGVRIYNTALSEAQVNYFMPPPTVVLPVPTFSGTPVINGNMLVLTYTGTLLGATNVVGPYLPVTGATSPYTNNVTAAPQMFYKLSNP